MSFLRYDRVIDKWLFGEITRKDLVIFAETEAHFNPKLKKSKALLEVLKDSSSTWNELEVSFFELLTEMGKEIPTQSRLEYIRSLNSEHYDGLINSITEVELNNIAGYDYGNSMDKYKTSLNKMIFEQNGLLADSQYMYPYEVIELGRHICSKGQEREFAICNCLVAKNILFDRDPSNFIADSFEDTYKMVELAKLPSDLFDVTMKTMILADRYQCAVGTNPHFFKR